MDASKQKQKVYFVLYRRIDNYIATSAVYTCKETILKNYSPEEVIKLYEEEIDV